MALVAVPNAPQAQWDALIQTDEKTPDALGIAIGRRPMRPFDPGAVVNPEPFRWTVSSAGTATTRTLTLPTSVLAEQVAILCIGWNNGGGFTLTSLTGTSTGWTQLGPGTFPADNTLTSTMYYKRLTLADAGATVILNFSGSLKSTAGIVAYDGIPVGTPDVAVLADTGTDEVHETPSLTTGDPSIIVNFVVERQATVFSTTASFAPGVTERFILNGGAASAGVTMIGGDTGATYVPAGTVGATSAAYTDDGGTATPSPNAIGWTVALTPGEVVFPPNPPPAQRGAVTLGTASYSIPATGVWYISPAGNDSTGTGTLVAPWATFAKAIATAVSGDTIIARAGTYREAISIPSTKRLTLQPYPNEAVTLNGTALQGFGWTPDSTPGRPCWRKPFGTAPSRLFTGPSPINPAYPLSTWPDQVFWEGLPAVQVATKAELDQSLTLFWLENPGSSGTLWINFDPTGAGTTVEATTRTDAIVVRSNDSVVRGFLVKGFGTIYDNHAAVRAVNASGVVFENMHVELNAMGGIAFVDSPNGTARFCSTRFNGSNGIKTLGSDNCLVEFNHSVSDNYQRFNHEVDGGGIRINDSVAAQVRYNLIEDPTARGIIVTAGSNDAMIAGNKIMDGTNAGLFQEGSTGGTFAGNLVIQCDKGAYATSGTLALWNNTFDNNRITWHFRGVGFEARNNIVAAREAHTGVVMWAEDLTNVANYTGMSWTTNYDWVWRKATATTPNFAIVPTGSSPSVPTTYTTRALYEAGTGQEVNGVASDNVGSNPYFNGDYSPIIGKVAPAPSEAIRLALGWASGTVNPGSVQS